MATLFTVFGKNFSWISQKQLPLGQKNVAVAERWPAVVERFKQESMHGEMDVSGGSTVLVFSWQFLDLFGNMHWPFPGLEHVSIFSWPWRLCFCVIYAS